jgi:hypothetical protein
MDVRLNCSDKAVNYTFFVNFQVVAGVSLDSGEGVLLRANSKGEIKVSGYTPSP